jgi:hypothetical protein
MFDWVTAKNCLPVQTTENVAAIWNRFFVLPLHSVARSSQQPILSSHQKDAAAKRDAAQRCLLFVLTGHGAKGDRRLIWAKT